MCECAYLSSNDLNICRNMIVLHSKSKEEMLEIDGWLPV